jgi:1,2-diacylglycerol 3-beta-glucosyltransferase
VRLAPIPSEENQSIVELPSSLAVDWQSFGSQRRWKALLVTTILIAIVVGLHRVAWGMKAVWGLNAILCLQALRLVTATPKTIEPQEKALAAQSGKFALVVAGKNEAAVIANIVGDLCQLDYPADLYEVWAIDDASTDATGQILDDLVTQYPQKLRAIHRLPDAGGGKSGALNQFLADSDADYIGVFDADARVPNDMLWQVRPYFHRTNLGAIQIRKAIANSETNWLTRQQASEMALDTFLQQQRIALGGVGELRGNGQFVRRTAIDLCGGWNEETIADDLDLTIKLHLTGWEIDLLFYPPILEEGVTTWKALWHQRNRWAEGGYQRYLDYWQPIFKNSLGTYKTFDLISFLLIQYLLPLAGVFDTIAALFFRDLPVLLPISLSLAAALPIVATYKGLARIYNRTDKPYEASVLLGTAIVGFLYTLHWTIVVPCAILRMSVVPKKLKWVKTPRVGD